MLRLKEVIIHRFKCVEEEQRFDVDEKVTVLVGMNESGKTAVLEAIAKTHHAYGDDFFRFDATHDYPRRFKKSMEKSGRNEEAVSCVYYITDSLYSIITQDIGEKVLKDRKVTRTVYYDNTSYWSIPDVDSQSFLDAKVGHLGLTDDLQEKLGRVKTTDEFDNLMNELEDTDTKEVLQGLRKYFEDESTTEGHFLAKYIVNNYLDPNLPKFLYYDEYYALPSRISIEKLQADKLEEAELKTARALFDLADIDVDELLHADDFEDYKAELEATQANISEEVFRYWSTNRNLEIVFDIDKVERTYERAGTQIVEHVLDIRVRNQRARVSLPLRNRSKGFNWFFSFLVWFKKIQEDPDSNYILLLDEPGLNLHAAAQSDLLDFINDLSSNYQIVYTTHSPFMIESSRLDRVRTILETETGSVVSDSLQEKDPNTLFPLQAALGYDIAQNLFISRKNLLVEGSSDLVYLQVMSSVLEEAGRASLSSDITIVPVGGLDRVSTFISLLRGNKLDIVCLLDSSVDARSKGRLNRLISDKLIERSRVLYFDRFLNGCSEADIEDLFTKQEYLTWFREAFPEHKSIKMDDLNARIPRITMQIAQYLGLSRFNHYLPAKVLLSKNYKAADFDEGTLQRFEQLFMTVNELMDEQANQ